MYSAAFTCRLQEKAYMLGAYAETQYTLIDNGEWN